MLPPRTWRSNGPARAASGGCWRSELLLLAPLGPALLHHVRDALARLRRHAPAATAAAGRRRRLRGVGGAGNSNSVAARGARAEGIGLRLQRHPTVRRRPDLRAGP